MTAGDVGRIAAICFLILLSAYFSATETAFSSLNKTRLRLMAERGGRRAALAVRLHDDYDKLISTILIGNNIVNIAMTAVATVLFVRLWGDIGATVSTIAVTVLVLIFGEVTPKSLAKDSPERFAVFSAPLISALGVLFTPVNFLFSLWKKAIGRLFRVGDREAISQEELLMLVDEVEQGGAIDEEEGSLLRNAIEFGDLRAEDILTHRVDVEAVSADSTREEVAARFTETKFSRLPVYEDNLDNIVGVIHQKDFYDGAGVTDKSLRDLMTPPIFVLKSEKLPDLLRLLQENQSHVAVVLDEYGGTLGIVTLEDVLEELVGEIWDEHDEVKETIRETGDGAYTVDCGTSLDDFARFFDLEPESDSVSVGGWVMERLGKIPEVGDRFIFGTLAIRVTAVDGQRITEILAEPIAVPADTGNNRDETTPL